MDAQLKPYSVSFYASVPLTSFEYHGPWWISGERADGCETVVAAVMAVDEAGALETLRLAYDEADRPAHLEERFCDPLTKNPFSERFQQGGWMKWPWPVVPLEPRPA